MPLEITVKEDEASVELLLFRAYGARGKDWSLVKATLDLNPGLSRHGPVLPALTKLKLADLPAETAARPVRVGVDLFDDED